MNGSHSFEGSILLLFKIIALIVFTTCKILKLLSFKVGGGGKLAVKKLSPARPVGGQVTAPSPQTLPGQLKRRGQAGMGHFSMTS